MPIEVSCPSCSRQFRVPDKVAGKKIKCPKCQGILAVPGSGSAGGSGVGVGSGVGAAAGSQVGSGKKWYLKTPDGAQYGPVPRGELDQWNAEGRITPQCQVLQEGAPQWQWAADLYPQSAGPAATTPRNTAPAAASATTPAQAAAPAPADNPFAGLGDSNAGSAGGGASGAPADPFAFAGADASPTARLRGGRRGGGRRVRKGGGKRSGIVTAVAVVNYILGGVGVVSCIIIAVIGMLFGATFDDIPYVGGAIVIFAIVGIVICSVYLVAGWGIQNREQWSRMLTIVLGILAVLSGNLPYGIFVLVVLLNKENAAEFR